MLLPAGLRVTQLKCAVGWETESYGTELCCCLGNLEIWN
jgi:hypothetical protein